MTVPEPLRVTSSVAIPLDEIVVRVSRSSGPGGQHANVTSSRVEVIFDVRASESLSPAQVDRISARLGPVVRVVAQDHRSQLRNRELALERLAERLAGALHVQRTRRPTRPTKGSKRRRVDAKKARGAIKRDRRRPDAD